MKLFERKPYTVLAWRVPELGERAEDPVPSWLVREISIGRLEINTTGGFTRRDDLDLSSCYCGDYVLYTDADTIEFCKANEFNHKFTLLDESLAA